MSSTELDLGFVDDPTNLFLAAEHDQFTLSEMYEWLGMLFLASPRVKDDDVIDPYLSSYSTPDFGMTAGESYDDSTRELGSKSCNDHDTTDANVNMAVQSTTSTSSSVRVSGNILRFSKVRWHGFISAAFVERMLLNILKTGWNTQENWASINVSCFGGANYTILVTSGGKDCFTWHCV